MPTQRKRIGFLPRLEVQNIIDEICKLNKISQSKVTGILVEEALITRGILDSSINNLSYEINSDNKKSLLVNSNNANKHRNKEEDNYNLDECYINDEVRMIKDYIEFKFFKNIMIKNEKKNN